MNKKTIILVALTVALIFVSWIRGHDEPGALPSSADEVVHSSVQVRRGGLAFPVVEDSPPPAVKEPKRPSEARLRGRVVGAEGRGLAGVRVLLCHLEPRRRGLDVKKIETITFSDQRGAFVIENPALGEKLLQLSLHRRSTESGRDFPLSIRERRIHDLGDLTMVGRDQVDLRFRITDRDGRPLVAELGLIPYAKESFNRTARTDADGVVRCRCWPKGSQFMFRLDCPGFDAVDGRLLLQDSRAELLPHLDEQDRLEHGREKIIFYDGREGIFHLTMTRPEESDLIDLRVSRPSGDDQTGRHWQLLVFDRGGDSPRLVAGGVQQFPCNLRLPAGEYSLRAARLVVDASILPPLVTADEFATAEVELEETSVAFLEPAVSLLVRMRFTHHGEPLTEGEVRRRHFAELPAATLPTVIREDGVVEMRVPSSSELVVELDTPGHRTELIHRSLAAVGAEGVVDLGTIELH